MNASHTAHRIPSTRYAVPIGGTPIQVRGQDGGRGYPICQQGVSPSQVWMGEGSTPSQVWMGWEYPFLGLDGGTPSQVWLGGTPFFTWEGVPPPVLTKEGGTPILTWEVGTSRPELGRGTPHPDLGGGTPHQWMTVNEYLHLLCVFISLLSSSFHRCCQSSRTPTFVTEQKMTTYSRIICLLIPTTHVIKQLHAASKKPDTLNNLFSLTLKSKLEHSATTRGVLVLLKFSRFPVARQQICRSRNKNYMILQ